MPGSDPVTMYTPEGGGQQHVFFKDAQGKIQHVFYDMASGKRTKDPAWAMGVDADSNLSAIYTPNPGGQQHVFYVGSVSSVHGIYQVFYDPSKGGLPQGPELWVSQEWLVYPTALYTPNGQQHLFYVQGGTGVGLYQLLYDQKNPNFGGKPYGPILWAARATSKPATLYTPLGNGQQHVFYNDGQGNIQHVFSDVAGDDPKPVTDPPWAPRQNLPAAAGNPATLYTPGQQHVFYADAQGNIWHVFYDERENRLQSDPSPWAPRGSQRPAASDLATLYTATPDAQQHVFYRDDQGSIWHVFYDAGSETLVSDSYAWATGAVGNPATLFSPLPAGKPPRPNGQQHVFYRDDQDKIWQVFYDSTKGGKPSAPEQWY